MHWKFNTCKNKIFICERFGRKRKKNCAILKNRAYDSRTFYKSATRILVPYVQESTHGEENH